MTAFSSASLYEQVMGADFQALAPELRAFHSTTGKLHLRGRCLVAGPTSILGRLAGLVFRLPPNCGYSELTFDLDADDSHEIWRRHFPGRTMTSRMRVVAGELVERLGPVNLHFALHERHGNLVMDLRRITCLGISCPQWLMPKVVAEERGVGGRLYFNVSASMPGIGSLVSYRGFLRIPSVAKPVLA